MYNISTTTTTTKRRRRTTTTTTAKQNKFNKQHSLCTYICYCSALHVLLIARACGTTRRIAFGKCTMLSSSEGNINEVCFARLTRTLLIGSRRKMLRDVGLR